MIALQHAWHTKLLDSRILKYEHRDEWEMQMAPPAHHKVWSYENNSRLKTNRSVHFSCTVRCTKNGKIAFIYLKPVNVDDLPRNASDHRPSPLPAPSPRPHRTAVLGPALAIPSTPTDL